MKNKIFIAIDTKNQKKALNIINQIKLKNFKLIKLIFAPNIIPNQKSIL